MKKVKSYGTGLEKSMESVLRNAGIKYQRQPKLAGKPDFRIRGTKILIFCDSSFWHGKREREVSGKAFKKNKAFWQNKLIENRKRDMRINRSLRKVGWSVWRFWDDDIIKRPDKVRRRLQRIVHGKTGK